MSTPPWDKTDFKDIKRYDWLTAVCVSDKHCDRPRDLRLANTLMQHMNDETGLSFPTQESLAKWSRLANDRQVREAIYSLEESGAVTRKRMKDLQPETMDVVKKLGNRTMRAVVYKLNLFWAFETFERYRFQLNSGATDARKQLAARMQYRPETDRCYRPESDRYKPAYSRPANTVGYTVETLGSALSEERPYYGREGRMGEVDPLVLIPPDDPQEARRWLVAICTDKSRLAEALHRLAMNDLPIEYLREIAA
jgi:hypothetical protein